MSRAHCGRSQSWSGRAGGAVRAKQERLGAESELGRAGWGAGSALRGRGILRLALPQVRGSMPGEEGRAKADPFAGGVRSWVRSWDSLQVVRPLG